MIAPQRSWCPGNSSGLMSNGLCVYYKIIHVSVCDEDVTLSRLMYRLGAS